MALGAAIRWLRPAALVLGAALGLTACVSPVSPTLAPAPRPALPPAASGPTPQSDESRQLATYYGRLQQDLLAQGLLRTDGGGPDVPFSKRNLVDNFVRIALFDEYASAAGLLIQRQTASNLRRWSGPVRFGVQFGDSIPLAQRSKDTAVVTSYAARLARATRHPISTSNSNPNFHVLILNEDERRSIGPTLRRLVPGIANSSVRTVENLPKPILCIVLAFSVGEGNYDYSNAVAVVRGEHTALMRQSCIHEELAQGLGLANDSPQARPSIFNDDEEFGLLTRHDELLLRMLYDRRLSTGMTAASARPIAEVIAGELLGGGS